MRFVVSLVGKYDTQKVCWVNTSTDPNIVVDSKWVSELWLKVWLRLSTMRQLHLFAVTSNAHQNFNDEQFYEAMKHLDKLLAREASRRS